MPNNKNFELRVEIIDRCLRNNMTQWTLEKLLEQVNENLGERNINAVSLRTIQNDLRFLTIEKNAPIERKRKGNSIFLYYDDPHFSIKNLRLRNDEINILKDAAEILNQLESLGLVTEINEVIAKLQNAQQAGSAEKNISIMLEKQDSVAGQEYLVEIYNAIKSKSCLRVTYKSFYASRSREHIFHPYLLKEYRNRWFVFGRIDGQKKLTNFAVDRIQQIRNSAKEFIPNDIFDPTTYFDNLIGVTIPEKEKVDCVELTVSRNQAPYVISKPIHKSQKIINVEKNGMINIRLSVYNNYEFRSVLLSFGSSIEVKKPLSLRRFMKTNIEKALNKYL